MIAYVIKQVITFVIPSLSFVITYAQPNNYYESCNGLNGEELKNELHNIIKNHTSYSYTTTKSILRDSDEDPNNSSNIILVYSGNSIDKFNFASNLQVFHKFETVNPAFF